MFHNWSCLNLLFFLQWFQLLAACWQKHIFIFFKIHHCAAGDALVAANCHGWIHIAETLLQSILGNCCLLRFQHVFYHFGKKKTTNIIKNKYFLIWKEESSVFDSFKSVKPALYNHVYVSMWFKKERAKFSWFICKFLIDYLYWRKKRWIKMIVLILWSGF